MNMTEDIMKANVSMYKTAVMLNISYRLPKGFTLDLDICIHRLLSKNSCLCDMKSGASVCNRIGSRGSMWGIMNEKHCIEIPIDGIMALLGLG